LGDAGSPDAGTYGDCAICSVANKNMATVTGISDPPWTVDCNEKHGIASSPDFLRRNTNLKRKRGLGKELPWPAFWVSNGFRREWHYFQASNEV
jgi:hypothetical protein